MTKTEPLNVNCDGDIFARQPHGGVRRSTECLLQGLGRRSSLNVTVQINSATIGLPPDIGNCDIREKRKAIQFRPGRFFGSINDWIARDQDRKFWSGLKSGIYLSTYYTTSEHIRLPQVSVVHDMIFEKFPDATIGSRQALHKAEKRRSISEAAAIICPSESARTDLVEFFDVSGKAVHVVPWGVDDWFERIGDERLLADFRATSTNGSPYILYVGGRSGTKNFISLLVAFSRWRLRRDVSILAVGGGAFSNEENCIIRSLSLVGRVHGVASLTNAELVVAYSAALGCVVPSLYEGFGFPVIEAMACGTPVACARVSSLPEVGGQFAHYFDPCSQDELILALDELVVSKNNAIALMEISAKARSRNWDVVAKEYESVFREVC